MAGIQLKEIPALEADLAGRGLMEPRHQQSDGGLARARFADHAERLALRDAKRCALHRLQLVLLQQSLAEVEALGETMGFQQRRLVAPQPTLALGGIRGRSPNCRTRWPPQFGLRPRIAHEVADYREAARPAVERRPAGEERARVRVARIAEELRRRRLLAHLAIAHDHHVVGDLAHEREVVGDKEHRHLVALLEGGHEIHDLALYGDVERGGRLIGNQQLRLAGDRHRDHHALLLAAGELERIGVEPPLGLGDTDLDEQFHSAAAQRASCEPEVLAQHFADLEAHREDRVERAHRLLEDHCDLLAAHTLHLLGGRREEIALAVENAASPVDGGILAR